MLLTSCLYKGAGYIVDDMSRVMPKKVASRIDLSDAPHLPLLSTDTAGDAPQEMSVP